MRNSFKASLGAGVELKEAVRLPPDQDRIEWIAMHSASSAARFASLTSQPAMELYNTLNLVCNFVVDVCTDKSCPEMTAGRGYASRLGRCSCSNLGVQCEVSVGR